MKRFRYPVHGAAVAEDEVDGALDVALLEVMASRVVAERVLRAVEAAAEEVRLVPGYAERRRLPPLHPRQRRRRRVLQTTVTTRFSNHGSDDWSRIFHRGKELSHLLYLEADVSGAEVTGENSDRSRVVSSKLLAVGASVARPVVPLDHRRPPPRSLKRDVRLRRRNHYLLSETGR